MVLRVSVAVLAMMTTMPAVMVAVIVAVMVAVTVVESRSSLVVSKEDEWEKSCNSSSPELNRDLRLTSHPKRNRQLDGEPRLCQSADLIHVCLSHAILNVNVEAVAPCTLVLRLTAEHNTSLKCRFENRRRLMIEDSAGVPTILLAVCFCALSRLFIFGAITARRRSILLFSTCAIRVLF